MQDTRSHLPSADRIGVLTASVLMAFALTRLIQSPRFTLTLDLPGFYFAFPITLSTFMTLLAAALAAAGMDWLTRETAEPGKKANLEHLLLPTITTWSGFAFGAVLLTAVFLAELVTTTPSAPSYAFARAGLTALAYALFLILAASLRFAGARLFILVPALFIFAGLISLRTLHLDGTDRWDFPWAIGIGLVCTQIGAGLHYWAITPVQFGLALTGPLYALTMLSMSLAENIPVRRAVVGPAVVMSLAWAAAVLL